jgi:hypothetical protein
MKFLDKLIENRLNKQCDKYRLSGDHDKFKISYNKLKAFQIKRAKKREEIYRKKYKNSPASKALTEFCESIYNEIVEDEMKYKPGTRVTFDINGFTVCGVVASLKDFRLKYGYNYPIRLEGTLVRIESQHEPIAIINDMVSEGDIVEIHDELKVHVLGDMN